MWTRQNSVQVVAVCMPVLKGQTDRQLYNKNTVKLCEPNNNYVNATDAFSPSQTSISMRVRVSLKPGSCAHDLLVAFPHTQHN